MITHCSQDKEDGRFLSRCDVNDGVRLSVQHYLRTKLQKRECTGAGILYHIPNFTWRKERVNESEQASQPDDSPWFWGRPGDGSGGQHTDFYGTPHAVFDGSRWNHLHYANTVKWVAPRCSHLQERIW